MSREFVIAIYEMGHLVEETVTVDVKAQEKSAATDKPKLLTYLRLSQKHLRLTFNFHVEVLSDGMERVSLNYDFQERLYSI